MKEDKIHSAHPDLPTFRRSTPDIQAGGGVWHTYFATSLPTGCGEGISCINAAHIICATFSTTSVRDKLRFRDGKHSPGLLQLSPQCPRAAYLARGMTFLFEYRRIDDTSVELQG